MDIIDFEKIVTVLLDISGKTSFAEEDIIEAATNARKSMPVDDSIFQQAIRNIHTKFNITVDLGKVIEDNSQSSWYPMRKAEINSYYWNRYKSYLQVYQSWPTSVINSIDRTTDEIMDMLGDPLKTAHFKRKGLLVGDVQSGKTATYTAICNKAADANYKVVILLTGTIESLRRQTQERIDAGFVGRKSKEALNRNTQTLNVGVGNIDAKRFAMTFTSEVRDFNASFLNNLGLRLKDNSEPVIFVVKKNKRILENLRTWLSIYNTDYNGTHIDLPLLLIDDEADNASVNTKGEDDPTAINSAIRDLLALFTKSTYLGVTATPFANIFINPDAEEEMLGDDLFPRNFIYSLPTPSNYIGSMSIFGEESIYDSNITVIDDINKDEDEYLRFHQKKTPYLQLSPLPNSLRESIYYYVLTNAIRDYRGQIKQHRSMLINISRLKNVHNEVSKLVNELVREICSDITNYCKLDPHIACSIGHIRELKRVWDEYNLYGVTDAEWELIQKDFLIKASHPIEVREINSSKSAKKLDYDEYKNTGARIIAVGGNALSRGLTLEGLCVSYFYRSTKMYDTLLQMGRWFGYRPGYDDLFRIYMTQDAKDWFQYITEATYELKNEISRMNSYGMTPSEFGLRVRQDINSLIVTARNKMRHTEKITRRITIAGNLIETPRLSSCEEILKENENATIKLFNRVEEYGVEKDHYRKERLYKNIDSNIIIEFLRNYQVHPRNLAFNSDAIINYIRNSNHLRKWDVAIPQGRGKLYDKLSINKQERMFVQTEDMLLVNGTKVRVGSGGCTKAGLLRNQVNQIIADYKLYISMNPDVKGKTPPDKEFLIQGRNPLLLIHALQMKENCKTRIPTNTPLIAVGIGFPKTNRDIESGTVQYVINLVALRNGIIEPEDEGDDFYDVE